jgi:hypothetical protein
MGANEQLIYPQAFLAQGNGDLLQVSNFTVTLTNNGKQVHTLRRKGAGVTMGTQETNVTFDAVIDEGGAERNYWRDVMRGTIRQIRAKAPGGKTVCTVNGMYKQCDLDGPLDDATKVSCTFIGHMEDVEV